ncbi:hypothetical protein S40288_05961 [Stachybotrys chartarum IBT 40288]|nr:hypothetical protein S40288_05961 [Stachybotrys chartarum IBT 40288]
MDDDPCLCHVVHDKCSPATCHQAQHASKEWCGPQSLRQYRARAADNCKVCAVVVEALSLPEIKAIWEASIPVAWESDRRASFTSSLLQDTDEIRVEVEPPARLNGRRLLRTKATERAEDWRHFNLWRCSDAELQDDACVAVPPLAIHPTSSTGSSESLSNLNRWIKTCNESHPCFSHDETVLPTRVVCVADGKVRILSFVDRRANYVTLSHRWGSKEDFILTQSNAQLFSRDIPWDSIPRLYQDAITLTRQLGIDYIWIDTLCIVQDDLDDWHKESARMRTVYGRSYLNIAANCSPNCHTSLFSSSDLPEKFPAYALPNHPEHSIRAQPFGTHFSYGSNHYVNESSPLLLQRGWVLQELLLSPRVVYFDERELKWECRDAVDCECGAMISMTTFKPEFYRSLILNDPPLIFQWMRVVERYSNIWLTFDEDRTVALAGIAAKTWEYGHGGRYLAGVWEQDLAHQLCWEIFTTYRKVKGYIAPSWSWLSIFGNVYYVNRMDFGKSESTIDVEIVEVSVTPPSDPAKAEIFGAVEKMYLKLHGRVAEMTVSLSYESDEGEESDDDDEESDGDEVGEEEENKSVDDDDVDSKSAHTEEQDKDHKGNNLEEEEEKDDTSDNSEQSLSSDMEEEEADFVPRYRFTHKQTREAVKKSAWMDYYMPAKRVAAIEEVLLLYWGEMSSHHVFIVLLAASGEENTYERIGLIQYASDGDMGETNRILSWLEPRRDIIFI